MRRRTSLTARTRKSPQASALRAPAAPRSVAQVSRLADDLEVPARQHAAIGKLQSTAGNQVVSRMFGGGMKVQRKVVTIEGELVDINSSMGRVTKKGELERTEATKILKELKDKYGLTVSSSKLIEGIKEQYTNVPKKVTKALKARKWRLNELRALATALSHYAPIMGAQRGSSTRKDVDQEVIYVGKAKNALDTNKKTGKLDTDTLGEYFKGKKAMGLFKASEGHHDVFKDEQQELVGTFIHEIAHGLLAYAYDDFVACSEYWQDQVTESGMKGAEKPPTEYGEKNAREDMCDTASLFFIEPSRLDKFPRRKAFMEKVGKEWLPTLKEAPVELGGIPKEGEAPKVEVGVPV